VCLDDERTVYLGVGDPANELYFCLAGEPGCRCRDNGSDLDEPRPPGVFLWPTYEGAAPEGAAP